MGLLEAFKDLCATEGPIGEIATQIGEGIFECTNSIADAFDDFADKLGGIETQLNKKNSEESNWAVDRFDPAWESTPQLKATRDAVDFIVNFCDKAELLINEATSKVLEMTGKILDT